jgi:hypothetical protein
MKISFDSAIFVVSLELSYMVTFADGVYAWNHIWYQKQQEKTQGGNCTSCADKKVATEGLTSWTLFFSFQVLHSCLWFQVYIS